jgi:CheY-like chemotaxis protein
VVRRVLIIEDNNEDFQAILRALGTAATDLAITRSLDGDDALDMLRETQHKEEQERLPDIILLDLNMPGTNGREILGEIKKDDSLKLIPVVVLSTSRHPKDIADCYRKGASGYCVKPINRTEFDDTIRAINSFWFHAVSLPGPLNIG